VDGVSGHCKVCEADLELFVEEVYHIAFPFTFLKILNNKARKKVSNPSLAIILASHLKLI
jgi:hypothetical protein